MIKSSNSCLNRNEEVNKFEGELIMKMPTLRVFQLFLLSLLLILFIGCGDNAPNNTEAETAIKESISKGITLKEFKIIKIGNVQGEGTEQYWPVKVFFSGNWKGGRQKSIEKETVYNVSKDGFGVWNAERTETY
jgi:hypothetical protein